MSDDAAVLAEIARLSSAIEQRKASGSTPPYRGSYRGRGARGRGRGGAPTAIHRNATWVAPGLSGTSTSTTASAAPTAPTSRTTTPVPVGGFRNQVLVLNKPADDSAHLSSAPSSAPTSRRPSPAPPVDATPKPPPPPREVVIGGVVFVADQRGNKLVRKPDADPSAVAPSSPSSPSVSTPKRTSHLGTTYIRTKAGNLVSLAFARRRKEVADARKEREDEMRDKGERLEGLVGVVRGGAGGEERLEGKREGPWTGFTSSRPVKPKSDKLCRFFQRTGQCSRAHTCPYVHDSSKIAICPLFLRSSCPRPASSCPLSHQPNPHRSPHCAHFPACTRGAACPYAHVRVGADAAPCRDFVELGWCALGDGCAKRHVRECWRFAETGRCDVKGCREPHVLRRVHGAEEDDDEDEDGEGEGGEGVGEELAIEWEEDEGDEEAAAAARGKRRAARDAEREGISGEAGRRLKKRLRVEQHERGDGGFDIEEDFVELSVPISDDDDDEDEGDEGMSVDSDDLDEEEREEGPVEAPDALPPATTPSRKTTSAPAAADIELDYGDDNDDSDDADIEQLLRR